MVFRFIRSIAFIFILMIFIGGIIYAEETGVEKDIQYASDKLLVIFYPETTDEKKADIRKGLGAELIKCLKGMNIEVWKLPEALSMDDAMKRLKEETSVECSEPEYMYRPLYLRGQDRLDGQ